MPPRIDRTGHRFGHLTVKTSLPYKKSICVCDCGKEKTVNNGNLISGHVMSCGCLRDIDSDSYNKSIQKKIKNNVIISICGCWEWKRSRNKQGYGKCGYKGEVYLAHRAAWIVFKGEIPDGKIICHTCDNPCCCNPEHLFIGTDKSNAEDGRLKGRLRKSRGEDHGSSKLNGMQVVEIREHVKNGMKYEDIAKKYGISSGHVCYVLHKGWKHIQKNNET